MNANRLYVGVLVLFFQGFSIAQQPKPEEWIDPLNPPLDLMISGKDDPDLIPLSHCYNVFFRTLATEASRGEEGYLRASALLMNTGIDPQYIDVLLTLAGDYEVEVSAIDGEAAGYKSLYGQLGNSTEVAAVLRTLDERRYGRALTLVNRVAEAVGFVQAQKVHLYVDRVVRSRVVLGGADAATALNNR